MVRVVDNSIFEMKPEYEEEERYTHPKADEHKFIRLLDFESIKNGMENVTSDSGVMKRVMNYGQGEAITLPAMVKCIFLGRFSS